MARPFVSTIHEMSTGSGVGRRIVACMTYEELLRLARRCEGKTLQMITGRRFRVGIYLDCPFFIPVSTGRGQSDGRRAAERFVARYNAIGSLRPGDYSGVSRSASYYVALLQHAGSDS